VPANGNGAVVLEMIQDRVRFATVERDRVIEALESALRIGRGRVALHVLDDAERVVRVWRFSSDLHCADCDIHYREPTPSLFSFNSPLGACESCRGFGRIIGIDFGSSSRRSEVAARRRRAAVANRVVPRVSGRSGALRAQARRAARYAVARARCRASQWVLEGEGSWEDKLWYGVRRFFAWLETKAYKMHIRVLLLEVSRVYPVYRLRRSASENRRTAVATGNAAGCERSFSRRGALRAQRHALECADDGEAGWRRHSRADAVADRALCRILRTARAARAAR
jgi:hypothetical protein